jgi:POT family proton-dependent oligopeptide transporter
VSTTDDYVKDRGRTFFGEPPALGYLAFTEAWERFSYYGMTALLVLYMSQALFLPGRIEGIAGFGVFRRTLEGVFGHMSTLALASQILGFYTAFVYFTPVLGGLIADRWLGRRTAVALGAVLMSAGHIAMAFDASFLIALVLLIVGCGFLKGNISSQVGELYGEDDGEGRTRGFSIFSMGINVGAVVGPLLCGLLAQIYGWHAGFGLAGGLMLIGLATYLIGYRHLPGDKTAAARIVLEHKPLTTAEWRTVAALGIVTTITVFQSIAYYQNTNIGLVWADRFVTLTLWGFHMPVAWFSSIDPFASVICVPPLFALWRWQAARGREPDDIGKIALGAWQAAFANLLLVLACLPGGRVPLVYPVVYDFILGVAFLYYWPPLLALVSRAAPKKLKATLMGAVFLSLFVGNTLVGWIGGFYEKMTPAAFWGLHMGIALTGGVLATLLARPLKRWLQNS